MAGTQAGEARRDAPQDEADGEPARGVSAIRRSPPPATQHASKPRHAGEFRTMFHSITNTAAAIHASLRTLRKPPCIVSRHARSTTPGCR